MRPPILDEIKRHEVLALLSHGVSRRAAAAYIDCSPNTILNHFRGDEAFRAAVLKSEANCETHCLAAIREAGSKHWRAAAWFLEKRFPKRYGKPAARNQAARNNARETPPKPPPLTTAFLETPEFYRLLEQYHREMDANLAAGRTVNGRPPLTPEQLREWDEAEAKYGPRCTDLPSTPRRAPTPTPTPTPAPTPGSANASSPPPRPAAPSPAYRSTAARRRRRELRRQQRASAAARPASRGVHVAVLLLVALTLALGASSSPLSPCGIGVVGSLREPDSAAHDVHSSPLSPRGRVAGGEGAMQPKLTSSAARPRPPVAAQWAAPPATSPSELLHTCAWTSPVFAAKTPPGEAAHRG